MVQKALLNLFLENGLPKGGNLPESESQKIEVLFTLKQPGPPEIGMLKSPLLEP